MDAENLALASGLVGLTYVRQGGDALIQRNRLVKTLLSQRRLPETGWPDDAIEAFVRDCAAMDSNNFPGNAGVGEREGRIACPLVRARSLGLAHGIGRSGDVAAEQPKAAGSSLLLKVASLLATDALREAGMREVASSVVLPAATGVAMMMVLLALRPMRPGARFVVWSRIDQKTCLKAILSAGLEVCVVEPVMQGDELVTDLAGIEKAIADLGVDNVLCVVTTTSCFAPRGCDLVVEVARMCCRLGTMHVVNHAYGVQSAWLCQQLGTAARRGTVTAGVQSTDKNFMVPVGGALVCDFEGQEGAVEAVKQLWPGRAGMSPVLDLAMTLLHWGRAGWEAVRQSRAELYDYLAEKMQAVAEHLGERVLVTPRNPISVAMTLDVMQAASATMLGSRLFLRRVSGARVVVGKDATVGGVRLEGYGAHRAGYGHVYVTAAAALGGQREDVDRFVERLAREYERLKASHAASTSLPALMPEGGVDDDKEGEEEGEGERDLDHGDWEGGEDDSVVVAAMWGAGDS